LSNSCPVLLALGAKVPFEIAVGVNGRVWVKAGTVRDTMVVANALKNSQFVPSRLHGAMVTKMLSTAVLPKD
jgi:exosome complex component RRP40